MSVQQDFNPGDDLIREGEPGTHLFVIQSGEVRLWKSIDGEDTTVGTVGAGNFVGEVATVLGRVNSANATAVKPTKCLVVDANGLESMVTKEPEIAVEFIRQLTKRLAETQDQLNVVGQRDSWTRVLTAIIRYAKEGEKTEEGIWIERRLSEIALEVAVPKAELGEISKNLVKLQLLRVKRNGILVTDLGKLRDTLKQG
ncbi:MAG: Crp/Fnr family transcriptional regulator [Myxococcota bacterium]